MVDNERLDASKADDVQRETKTPLACCSSPCSAFTQIQTAQLGTRDAEVNDQSDGVIDSEEDKSTSVATVDSSDVLRQIVIDGSNIAMSHGNRTTFSCRGIKLAVDWFRQRGHKNITVFVPQWRRETHKQECTVTEPQILSELEQENILVFTPSRKIRGKRIVCHDDRYIVKLAAETDGVIVSNDTYRDLAAENQDFCKAIEERLLMYSFVNDRFMPPDDPLGRYGPSLDDFLRNGPVVSEPRAQVCPYAKCTYGAKCRYYHPERANSYHRPVSAAGSGDKLSGSRTDSRDLCSGTANLATPCPKKKLTSSRRSYEKQHPENKHLNLKPFHSDPTDSSRTNSSRCGHLVLAKELSREYKRKPVLMPGSSVDSKGRGNRPIERSELKPNRQDADAAYEPERLHHQLTRQLAVQGNSDPRAESLGKTYNVSYGVEQRRRDAVGASNELSVDLSTELGDVSSCSSSAADTATPLDSSISYINRVNQVKPEHPQHSLASDPQQFATTRRNSQDHLSQARFRSPRLLASTRPACTDNLYFVRPVVLRDLHSAYRQFPAPQLMPRFPMSSISSTCPQMFVYQRRSYLPQNSQMRASVVSTRHFLHS